MLLRFNVEKSLKKFVLPSGMHFWRTGRQKIQQNSEHFCKKSNNDHETNYKIVTKCSNISFGQIGGSFYRQAEIFFKSPTFLLKIWKEINPPKKDCVWTQLGALHVFWSRPIRHIKNCIGSIFRIHFERHTNLLYTEFDTKNVNSSIRNSAETKSKWIRYISEDPIRYWVQFDLLQLVVPKARDWQN